MERPNYVYENYMFLRKHEKVQCTSNDRFLEFLEEKKKENPEIIIPFSSTLKNCIGAPNYRKHNDETLSMIVSWYKYLLGRDVTIEQVKGRTLATSCYINYENENISGNYIACYLDPIGSGNVKGMYLRLDGDISQLCAKAIHNLKNLDFIEDVKPDDESDINIIFKKIGDRGSKLLTGVVNGDGDTIEIELIREGARHKITLIFNISSYINFLREDNSSRKYSGGLGLMVVTNDTRTYGCPYVARVGLIRSDKIGDISLQDSCIKEYLSINPHITQWGPLKLDTDKDSLWFEWFVGRYEEWEKPTKQQGKLLSDNELI